MKPEISIVVPTYNRSQSLRRCLNSLLVQSIASIEIIIINNGSTDDTSSFLHSVSDPRIRTINKKMNDGAAAARNAGAAIAASDIIACIDDDCVADEKWAERIMQPFTSSSVHIVIGKTVYVFEHCKAHFPDRMVSNNNGQWPGAGNIAFRRATFEKLSGFNPFFEQFKNEDTEFAIRAATKGIRITKQLDALVFHERQQWKARALLSSARNASVWPILKKMYPDAFRVFGGPVKFGTIVDPIEYGLLLLSPVIIPIQLFRYLRRGNKNLALFFAKWPLWFLLKRILLWSQAIRQKVFML